MNDITDASDECGMIALASGFQNAARTVPKNIMSPGARGESSACIM
ncbi:hypothetical protein PPGU19_085550 (plasmid) [Paraburkholderia sp. PGU19]|nr:hypothetical protein PPGU19_085550 [Paraburkholderia sp. PGU19]